ncbi:MAG: hypothetical protein HXS54_01205 [Theionarchaea archaeon]|nr:hypothetical protein [Theionarchaea archaeon]
MATVATEIKEQWIQEHDEIAEKYIKIIENNIPPDILIEGVTIDFVMPSEGKIIFRGAREDGEIKERVFVFVAPSTYQNAFKNRRRDFYTLLKRNAFILGKGQGGRNLYLIPLSNVQDFIEGVRKLQDEFKSLEEDVNAYLRGETGEDEQKYLEKVKDYLKKHNEFSETMNFKVTLRFSVSLMPLRIDSKTFMNFASDQIRKEMEEALKLLEEEFALTSENIIHQMISDLTDRFSKITSRLASALEEKSSIRYGPISKAVDEAMNLAASSNLDSTFKNLAIAVKSTADVLSKKEIERTDLVMAAQKIAIALDIDEQDSGEILKKASHDLTAMSTRAAEVIRRM